MLRKKATQPERILWRHLRNRNFAAYKFSRQYPFEDYVLDFYCPTAMLAIELDGGGHNYRTGQIRDRTRSEFLARHGVIVLRFWNHQVRRELDSVLRAIWFALGERQQNKPSPSSSPLKRERRSLTGVQFEIIYASCRCAPWAWQARRNTSFSTVCTRYAAPFRLAPLAGRGLR
jgi:very-short-patch-repair endonuclease